MMRFLLALMILRLASTLAAEKISQPLSDYQLATVFRMGDYAEAVVLHPASGERYRLKEGVVLDGFCVTGIVPRSNASYVTLERDGEQFVLGMSRSGELGNMRQAMSLAQMKGHVTAEGRLTSQGRRAIRNNLQALCLAAHVHMSETGAETVDLATLVKVYQLDKEKSNDPFAAPVLADQIRVWIDELDMIDGENYSTIKFTRHLPKVSVRTATGELVEEPFASRYNPRQDNQNDPFALFSN